MSASTNATCHEIAGVWGSYCYSCFSHFLNTYSYQECNLTGKQCLQELFLGLPCTFLPSGTAQSALLPLNTYTGHVQHCCYLQCCYQWQGKSDHYYKHQPAWLMPLLMAPLILLPLPVYMRQLYRLLLSLSAGDAVARPNLWYHWCAVKN